MINLGILHGITGVVAIILLIWVLVWKVYAVWMAAKHNHKKWFVALLLLNTASILELIYVFHIQKKTWHAVKKDFSRAWESLTSSK
ncbi:MAG TPA: DUF5652 family protein [Candidatus Paceibacterota bacterium]